MAALEPSNPKAFNKDSNIVSKDSQSRLTKVTNGMRLLFRVLGLILPYSMRLLRLRIAAIQHDLTYKPVESPKNIIVVGGSFAGVHVANWLANDVPTGYRVVLVEKNSHFNYLFAFPRYSVVAGYEQGAFISYPDILRSAIKKGSLLHVHGEASSMTASQLLLTNEETIDYAYLVLATGSWQPPPARLKLPQREDACDELRSVQRGIARASKIAILGSGAVGVEIAADVKSRFPNKFVTLFSSRDAVMPSFEPKLQVHVADVLSRLGVAVRYNARPHALSGGKLIQLADGSTEEFDMILSCTGQTPNSGILSNFLPEAISKQTSRILVKSSLQLQLADESTFPNIFALGDVAEHGGPRMARAVYMQAGVVRDNVLELLQGRPPSYEYSPQNESLAYVPGENDKDMLFSGAGYPEDFKIAQGWRLVGARYPGRQ